MAGKIATLVEEEAARAEAEEAAEREEVDGGPEAPDSEAFPAEEVEDEPMSDEAAFAALADEQDRHERELARIMRDDFAAFARCEFCDGLGHRVAARLREDDTLTICNRCGGEGQMLTGSKNPGYAVRDCLDCQGQGFVVKPLAVPEPAYTPPPAPMFDPYTGERIVPAAVTGTLPQVGTWAPGYTPPATGVPGGHTREG